MIEGENSEITELFNNAIEIQVKQLLAMNIDSDDRKAVVTTLAESLVCFLYAFHEENFEAIKHDAEIAKELIDETVAELANL